MSRLTVEQAAREAGSDGSGATALNLSHRALSDVSCLSSFIKLERLDLGYNCLVTLEVLNAGKNKLTKMDEVASLTSLGALILNDNNISSICKLDRLQQLNTLVLSKNPVFTIGNALAKAKSMKKLSLSHCQIENIGSSLAACVELKELRLSHNKITTIPSDLAKNVKILNLDLGNNLIERSSDLKVLSELRYLRNLNLQGNPISETDSHIKKVKKFVPNLRILNAKPLEASSKSDESYGKENLPSKDDPVEIDRKKKDKRKQTKQQLKGPEEPEVRTISPAVTTSAIGKSEVLDGKERKKDRKEAKKKSEVEEHANDSKSKRKDAADDTGRKDKKDAKRKKFVDEEDIDAEGIDNTEISFADLVFSKHSSEPKLKDRSTQEVAPGGTFEDLVIDHTKKRKKSKGAVTITDSSALKMISSVPDVGTGGLGLSGWDD
ncbi:unnamed protein product [Urochloa humidicola]